MTVQYVQLQVWRNAWTCYRLTQHWKNLKVLAAEYLYITIIIIIIIIIMNILGA